MTLGAWCASIRRRGAILSAAGACLIAIGCFTTPALAAPPPQGALTDQEFTLLSASKLGLDQALGERGPNWQAAAQNGCLTVTFGASTPLLASEKTDCLESLTLQLALTTFSAEYAHCAARGRTGKIVCLAPLYKALARDAKNAYMGALKTRRTIVERGLTGACLATLASTPKQLAHDRELVISTNSLSADLYTLIRIDERKAPASRLKQDRLNADGKAFDNDVRLVALFNSPDDLDSCPHPPA